LKVSCRETDQEKSVATGRTYSLAWTAWDLCQDQDVGGGLVQIETRSRARRDGRDKLFANQPKFKRDSLFQYARELGLDMKRFEHSLGVEQARPLIDADTAEAKALGITGTPAFFVNGRYLSGAKPFDEFAQLINGELTRLKLPVPAPPVKRDAKAGG
jgi:hypothetical protein